MHPGLAMPGSRIASLVDRPTAPRFRLARRRRTGYPHHRLAVCYLVAMARVFPGSGHFVSEDRAGNGALFLVGGTGVASLYL